MESFSRAKTYYRRAKRLAIQVRQPSSENDASLGLALCDRGTGQWDKAEKGFREFLSRYRDKGDLEGVAFALWALGTTRRFSGKFRGAEDSLRQSIRLYRKTADRVGLAYALCGLGGTLRMRGRARESGRLYAAAQKIFRGHGDSFGVAYSQCGRSNATRMLGQLPRAMTGMAQAARLYARLDQKGPRAFVLWSRAQAEIELRQFRQAAVDLRTAGRLFGSVGDRRGLVYVNLGWGEWGRAQDLRQARGYYRKAFSSAKRLKLPFEAAHARKGLGDRKAESLYRRMGVDLPLFRRYNALP